MLGAIAGDIIGSVHEGAGTRGADLPLFADGVRFTDDTVLTVAVAHRLLRGGDCVDLFHEYFHAYPQSGFGWNFTLWAGHRRREPYLSLGNGSAMRVSPIGFASATIEETLARARESAEVTHNHPEGIRGAQATAASVFLARTGRSKREVRAYVEREFGYDLSAGLDEIRAGHAPDETCPGSVPPSSIAFLESRDYESAVRNAVSLGGDADTMACIAGGIAEAFYGGVPGPIAERALLELAAPLREIVLEFCERFMR
jgi:ADP-ribosylglycohydrolase